MRPKLDRHTLLVSTVFDLIIVLFVGVIYIFESGSHFSLERHEWRCAKVVVNPPVGEYVLGSARAAPPEDKPLCVNYQRRKFSESDAHDQWSSARTAESRVVAVILFVLGVPLIVWVISLIRRAPVESEPRDD